MSSLPVDIHSYGNPGESRVRHVHLDLVVSFKEKKLKGTATLALEPAGRRLVLDTRDLTILQVNGSKEGFRLGPRDPILGSPLEIDLPSGARSVVIEYETTPQASGLQWLAPAQTAGKRSPFLFSQSQAIHARSWIPIQDSPAVRVTFSARIQAAAPLTSLMAAVQLAPGRFHMPWPVPPYLIALAVGELQFRPLGPRTGIWAEPPVLARAASEFADMEQMVEAAERLYGPYRWGRYDLIVLPPSFPFGGMENANMTFATPTIVVGDKSLASVISHELAHSWSGNLVTNATWRDGWLNEGFTTYVQGRITEAVYGKSLADEEALLSARALEKSIGSMPANAQKLTPDLRGVDADDALSSVAYDKGSWFLRTLEQRFGRADFDAYLRSYFDHFAFQSITTEQMLAYMKPNLIDKYPGKMRWAEVQDWVYGTGIPKDAPLPDSPRFDEIDRERAAFLGDRLSADKLDAKGWNTQEWMYFLDRLPDVTALTKIKTLDAAWHLTGTPNAEIGMRWYVHAIAAGDKDVWPAAAEHMTRIGRLYLTLPLYKAFAKTPEGLAYAKQVYAKAKAGYHPLTQQAVEGILAKASAAKK